VTRPAGSVLVEVSVVEQRYSAVNMVLVDGLWVTQVADATGGGASDGAPRGIGEEGWARSLTGPTRPTAARIRCTR
jgi:hypothetical protein